MSKEEEIEIVVAGGDGGQEEESEDEDYQVTDSLLYGLSGKHMTEIVHTVDDSEEEAAAGRRAFTVCMTLCFSLVLLAGVILMLVDQFENSSTTYIVGVSLVCVASICILPCCCVSCCVRPPQPKKKNDKLSFDDRFELRRLNPIWNSRQRLSLLHEDNPQLSSGARSLVKKLKENKSKNNEDLEHEVKTQIEATLRRELTENPGVSIDEVKALLEPTVYVIHFTGDMGVSKMGVLRDQISMILKNASPNDELVFVLNSPGGLVQSYGLAASQLLRVKKKGIKLTVCVDLFAASGGYMMAVVADKIIAAPFAFVGSIGVVSYMANVQRVLDDHKVDTFLFTAGEFKRTVDVIGEVTEAGIAKQQEELEQMHEAFKRHCNEFRSDKMNIEEVATGEGWLATEALEKGLIDELGTSDDYILGLCENYDVFEVAEKKEKPKSPLELLLAGPQSNVSEWGDFVYDKFFQMIKAGQHKFRAVA